MKLLITVVLAVTIVGCGSPAHPPPMVDPDRAPSSSIAGGSNGSAAPAPASGATGGAQSSDPLGHACAELGACCLGLAPNDEAACRAVEKEGSPGPCSDAHARLCTPPAPPYTGGPCSPRSVPKHCDGSVQSVYLIECALSDCFG